MMAEGGSEVPGEHRKLSRGRRIRLLLKLLSSDSRHEVSALGCEVCMKQQVVSVLAGDSDEERAVRTSWSGVHGGGEIWRRHGLGAAARNRTTAPRRRCKRGGCAGAVLRLLGAAIKARKSRTGSERYC